ncbi:TfoX/Sxy family protein [Jatrophihabitans sp.]|uniref:TfoX/Sxy family protein n=1 Tax=Jatrophihabitans sp. TaxID=1932789 RepID=UPI002BA020C3|nr:TfoX/Sxy family protein [Jatrophihabitans sp.]
MPYDRELADRIRASLASLAGRSDVREVGMFGGLSFLVDGKLAVSADTHGDLMIRCSPDRAEQLLEHQDAEPVVMGRRRMSPGWLRIRAGGVAAEADLEFWISEALDFTARQAPGKRGRAG